MLTNKKNASKKFSLNDFKGKANTIQSKKALEAITGGIEDACHPTFSRTFMKTGSGGPDEF